MIGLSEDGSSEDKGFTLVELIVTMVISLIISGALYSTYLVQHKNYLVQEQVAEMQQNIRAALLFLERDIRMAGYDPKDVTSNNGFEVMKRDAIAVKFDLNGDGDTNDAGEHVGYDLLFDINLNRHMGRAVSKATLTATANPIGSAHFELNKHRPFVENIDALEFQYLDATGGTTLVASKVRAVRVSILARASRPDPKFTNAKVYVPASGVPWDLNGSAPGNAANDNFRRRLLITTIQCRNMGL